MRTIKVTCSACGAEGTYPRRGGRQGIRCHVCGMVTEKPPPTANLCPWCGIWYAPLAPTSRNCQAPDCKRKTKAQIDRARRERKNM